MVGLGILLLVVVLAICFLIYRAFGIAGTKRIVEVIDDQDLQGVSGNTEKDIQEHLTEDKKQVTVFKKKLSKYVAKEVQKKVLEQTTALRDHYEQVLEKKNKSLDIAINQVKIAGVRYQELDTSFREMGEEKKQTEEVVHSMAEGVIMVNKKGEIMLMNPAAEKLLGVKKESKIGQSILSDLKEEQLVSLVQQPADGAQSKEIVIQSQNDKIKKVLLASNAVIESEDGKTVGFVSVLSDVTKQKEVEALKEEFLASVSHDLRTPLTCIRGALQLLTEGGGNPLSPSQERNLAIASKNIERLSRLINDLLDLSKLESKKFTIRPTLYSVEDHIHSLMSGFEAWIKTKEIVIRENLERPLEVEADQDRLGQVLTNLISNALKFTPQRGTVTLIAKHASGGQKVEIGVHDSGPGIAEKDFPNLFQKFSRIESKAMQGISGTGLGLAIAKEIVELHIGRIWVESEEGKGSYFAFEIPVKYQAPLPPKD